MTQDCFYWQPKPQEKQTDISNFCLTLQVNVMDVFFVCVATCTYIFKLQTISVVMGSEINCITSGEISGRNNN